MTDKLNELSPGDKAELDALTVEINQAHRDAIRHTKVALQAADDAIQGITELMAHGNFECAHLLSGLRQKRETLRADLAWLTDDDEGSADD